ncbi:hypothetical protein [Oerskovia sp. USHLN155]|uniref:hypothetical protein n=1 Tax=Oerskovia sp. USHLN155 TaxID=3081288 RepID=UPI00301670D6
MKFPNGYRAANWGFDRVYNRATLPDMETGESDTQEPTRLTLTFHGPAWFAEQLDVSESWVRKNAKSLPHHRVGSLLKFDDHCVEIFRDRTAVAPSDSMLRTERSRNRRRK